ncbi:hypothetical protein [Heyndrickxia vini]|uniref:Uncharacterized protein n=1 Tax=Heyndrickxia vini TaxID=1476025 RepID=A0ABX7DW04_9BACI|nr:hypothetical protein [Heyndrickxia vini]QQZ07683.1 hypothetical protein I5776_11300 [Heyndrickxia vini]
MMPLNSLKYRNFSNEFVHLEDWMKFSIELANFVKQTKQPIKLFISLPSNLLFSYFFVFGAIDYDFRNVSKETLLRKYLSLKKGQRILYKSGNDWVAHSVLEVSKIPNTDTKAIVVKDRTNCINYIPETRWFDYIRIYDNEVTEVRNKRRVNNVENITNNIKLKNLYSEYNLNLLMMQNIPKTYLYANKKEWIDNISVIELEINEGYMLLDELLYDGTEGTFKNFSFIQQNQLSLLPNESTIIFVGSSRSLRMMDQFKQQKCIFIADLHESNEKIEDLQFKIEQEFLMDKGQCLNKDILEFMNNNQIEIPKGVEIFAW